MNVWDGYQYEDERRRGPRKRVYMSREVCKERGLYWAPGDIVDMHAFMMRHPVELPDGRRFVSQECALKGLDDPKTCHKSYAAKEFWRREGYGSV